MIEHGPHKGKLITSSEAPEHPGQLTQPCSDCPWARKSLPGWLGGISIDDWIACAHADGKILCHAFKGPQCAGAAIFRRHICKSPRDPEVLVLPADREKVFSWHDEFREHHEKGLGAS